MALDNNWQAICEECIWARKGFPIQTSRFAEKHTNSRNHIVILLNNGNIVTRYLPRDIIGQLDQPPY